MEENNAKHPIPYPQWKIDIFFNYDGVTSTIYKDDGIGEEGFKKSLAQCEKQVSVMKAGVGAKQS